MTPFHSQRGHVARLIESLRLQRGLRPGELAARLGAANPSKVGSLIRTFELGEPICELSGPGATGLSVGALDAHFTLADLRRLTHDELVLLAVELRHRLELLEEELQELGRQWQAARGDVADEIYRAMVDLRHFLLFFEDHVLRHRLRRRRDGQTGTRAGDPPRPGEVA